MIKPTLKTLPHIEVVIEKDGSVKIHVKNYAGAGCREATAALERALGVVTDRKDTGGQGVQLSEGA
jgi:hypothetical protein